MNDAKELADAGGDPVQLVAQQTQLAKGRYAAFFERNKDGIQYVDVSTRTYFISRSWTLRGPIPSGARIEHTGLAGYKDDSIYNAQGYKRYPRVRTGGTHSKRKRKR